MRSHRRRSIRKREMTMSRRLAAAALALPLALPGISSADTSVGVRAGTLGLGVELSYAVSQRVALRLGADTYSPKVVKVTQQDIDYDAKAKLRSGSLLIDWFPFANNFRFSLGAVLNRNKLTATGKPDSNGQFTINGQPINATDVSSLDAEVSFRKTAPYFGIGYGRPINGGLSFISDLGVMFQGVPKSTLTATCSATATVPNCNTLQSAVAAEQATLQDNVGKFKYYPVLSIGLAYTF
jgi:hypothetical protein